MFPAALHSLTNPVPRKFDAFVSLKISSRIHFAVERPPP